MDKEYLATIEKSIAFFLACARHSLALDLAEKQIEPARTNFLKIILVYYISRAKYEEAKEVASMMKEPERKEELNSLLNKVLEALVVKGSYYEANRVARELNRTLTPDELKKIIKECFVRNKLETNNFARLAMLDQTRNAALELSEPDRTEELKKFCKAYEAAGSPECALETAKLFSFPERTKKLEDFLKNFVNAGNLGAAQGVAALLDRILTKEELITILGIHVNGSNLSSAESVAKIIIKMQ